MLTVLVVKTLVGPNLTHITFAFPNAAVFTLTHVLIAIRWATKFSSKQD